MKIIWKCRRCELSGTVQHPSVLSGSALIQKIRDAHYAAILNNGKICRWNDGVITMRRVVDEQEEDAL